MNSFIDEMEICLASGHGGAGAVSFRREKYIPKGGPDGGDGGQGGNVILQLRSNLKTLTHLRANKTYSAQNGFPGEGRKKYGRAGTDLIISVPPGTQVKDAVSGELLLDLLDETDGVLFLRGGIGGKGNTHFATSRKQTPRFAQPGMPGEERQVRLVLSLIADIGFVGHPNAGKSSLLSVLTAANPKIAAYPFTTKIPNLGVLRKYNRDIILADIPGLIEGAARGAGLGHSFLKHISRTKALLFLIDFSDNREPIEVFRSLKRELADFDPGLLKRSHYILATKMDIAEARWKFDEQKHQFDQPIFPISSAVRSGIDSLTEELFNLVKSDVAPIDMVAPDYYSYDPDAGGET